MENAEQKRVSDLEKETNSIQSDEIPQKNEENSPVMNDESNEASTLLDTSKANQEDLKEAKTKKTKKTKTKGKRKPVGTAGFVAICISLSLVCAFLGGVGGYFLYQQIKPEAKYESSYSDFVTLRERAEKNPNLLKEFEGEEYNIVNVALDKYTQHKHTLTMGYGEAKTKANGVQTVKAVTIGGENKAFNQNISCTDESAIVDVKTAFRFYYDISNPKAPSIEAFEKKIPSDWSNDMSSTNTYTADQFIKKYGKLNYGEYIVDSEDKFLTLGSEGEGTIINGVSIYQINSKSVVDYKKPYKNSKGNYVFDLTLLSNAACKYYVNQIKTNGGTNKNPRFEKYLKIQFELNKDFELVSSFVDEQYEITIGITADCLSTMRQVYFYSDDETHVVEGQEINIPEKGQQFVLDMDVDGNVFKAN